MGFFNSMVQPINTINVNIGAESVSINGNTYTVGVATNKIETKKYT